MRVSGEMGLTISWRLILPAIYSSIHDGLARHIMVGGQAIWCERDPFGDLAGSSIGSALFGTRLRRARVGNEKYFLELLSLHHPIRRFWPLVLHA